MLRGLRKKLQPFEIFAVSSQFYNYELWQDSEVRILQLFDSATIQAVTLRVFNLFSIGKKFLEDPVSYFPNLFSEFDDTSFLYPNCYK